MKPKILIGIVGVLAVAGALYFYNTTKQENMLLKQLNKGGKEIKPLDRKGADESVKGSLFEIAARGIPLKCKYSVQGNEFDGLIKGKNFKGKIVNATGESGNILMKQNCMYTWEDGTSQGISICFEDTEESIWEQTGEGMPDEYNCRPAIISDSEFALPEDIQFLGLEDLMNSMGDYTLE